MSNTWKYIRSQVYTRLPLLGLCRKYHNIMYTSQKKGTGYSCYVCMYLRSLDCTSWPKTLPVIITPCPYVHHRPVCIHRRVLCCRIHLSPTLLSNVCICFSLPRILRWSSTRSRLVSQEPFVD